MSASKTLLTAEDLLAMEGDERYELVRGELVEMPPSPGGRHANEAARFAIFLGLHGELRGLGKVFDNGGFRIERDPDTVRAPDVAFVVRERLPEGDPPEGYLDLTPDIVVEVVSPSDTAGDLQARATMWLRAGARIVWVAYPDTRTITDYRSLTDVKVLTVDDRLDAAPVLPEFSVPVKDLF